MRNVLLIWTLLASAAAAQDTQSLLFLGPLGTYSDSAAQTAAKSFGLKTALASSITDVAQQVAAGKYAYGLLPIENSSGGYVAETSTIFSKTPTSWRVIGMTDLPIDNTLLVKPGTSAANITTIVSHPQPFLQSAQYLKANFPNVKRVEVKSTAAAAEEVARNSKGEMAAIAAPAAAQVYGLEPLAEKIQDDKANTTRFLIITSRPFDPEQSVNRAMVSFEPRENDNGLSLEWLLMGMRKLGFRPTGIMSAPRGTLQQQHLNIFFSGRENRSVAELQAALEKQIGRAALIGAFQQ